MEPYKITQDFEQALCQYTGAPFAVAVNSCTAALQLSLLWFWKQGFTGPISLPRRTYVSVPSVVKQSGFSIRWHDEPWRGAYQLRPLTVWDSARRFTTAMYKPGDYQCVSFSASKILAHEQGGAILHDDAIADRWFRKMRFDGRTEGADSMTDDIQELGHHCIMLPSVAAHLLVKLYHLPKHNEDLPDREYPDCSKWRAFQ